jgi:hypothetical protein
MPLPDVQQRSGAKRGIGGLAAGLAMFTSIVIVRRVFGWLGSGRKQSRPRVDSRSVNAGHETREVRVGPPILGGILVVLGIGCAILVATWFQTSWVARPLTLSPPPGRATPVVPPLPPEPRPEAVSGAQLRDLHAAEDAILTSTDWVDRDAGIARIPITRALDLAAERGLPARSADEARQYRNGAEVAPSGASSGRTLERRTP